MSANHTLLKEELAEYREIFNIVDKDGDGIVSRAEFEKLMRMLKLNPTEAEISDLISQTGTHKNNELNFNEFVSVMTRRIQLDYTKEQLQSAFKVFETTKNSEGTVSTQALHHALTNYCTEALLPEQATNLLSLIETDSTGTVNYIDFINSLFP